MKPNILTIDLGLSIFSHSAEPGKTALRLPSASLDPPSRFIPKKLRLVFMGRTDFFKTGWFPVEPEAGLTPGGVSRHRLAFG